MERDWDARARENAPYFVNTTMWDGDLTNFFLSGASEAYLSTQGFFRKMHFESSDKRMLEIGCGIGRMTRGFCEMFQEVYGVDVSGEMIQKALELNSNLKNVKFIQNNGRDLADLPSSYFDFVFSYAVFQHIPEKEIIRNYFYEIHRVLKRGGLFKLQVQVHGFTYAFGVIPVPRSIIHYIPAWVVLIYNKLNQSVRYPRLERGGTFHGACFKRSELQLTIRKTGLTLIEISDDTAPGGASRVWCLGRKW